MKIDKAMIFTIVSLAAGVVGAIFGNMAGQERMEKSVNSCVNKKIAEYERKEF